MQTTILDDKITELRKMLLIEIMWMEAFGLDYDVLSEREKHFIIFTSHYALIRDLMRIYISMTGKKLVVDDMNWQDMKDVLIKDAMDN